MKIIKYTLRKKVNLGTESEPIFEEILTPVSMSWSENNEEIAKREAHNGEYTIEDDGVAEVVNPSQMDRIEAQVTYTAIMTDTLLEV